MGDEVTNGAWVRPKNLTNSANKPTGPTTTGSIYNTKDWPTLGEAVNCVDNAKNNNNWDNINKRQTNSIKESTESSAFNNKSSKRDNNLNFSTVNISKSVSEIVISEETNSFSKLLITKEPVNCNNTSEISESPNVVRDIENGDQDKGQKSTSDTDTATTSKDASNFDPDDDSAKENIDGSHSSTLNESNEPNTSKVEDISNASVPKGKKKGYKNRWRPLDIEPPVTKVDDRRKGQRVPKKKETPPNQENDSVKKFPEATVRNGGTDKGFRGSRRGRGRGGRGGNSQGLSYRGRIRGFDSGRVTPNQPIHDDFTDIAYYVDFSPINDTSVATESDIGSGVISPTLASTGAAFLPTAVIPTTTAFVPSSYFAHFAPMPAPTLDPDSLKKCIKTQVEYYFSEENLQRDFFLRRKMDKEGYLPISLIASFHRVTTLTNDVDMVIDALLLSEKIEFDESRSKVRTKLDPLKWPIRDERVSSTQ